MKNIPNAKEIQEFQIINFIVKIDNIKYKINFKGIFNGNDNSIKIKNFDIKHYENEKDNSIKCITSNEKSHIENDKLKISRKSKNSTVNSITDINNKNLRRFIINIENFVKAYFVLNKGKSNYHQNLINYNKNENKFVLNFNNNNLIFFNKDVIQLLNFYIQDSLSFFKNVKKYTNIKSYKQSNYYIRDSLSYYKKEKEYPGSIITVKNNNYIQGFFNFYRNGKKYSNIIAYIQKKYNNIVPLNEKITFIKNNKLVYLILLLKSGELDLVINFVKRGEVDINKIDENNYNFFSYILKYSSNARSLNKVYRSLRKVVDIEINSECFKNPYLYNLILNNKRLLKLFIKKGLYLSKEYLTIMDVIINFELIDLGKVVIDLDPSIVNKRNNNGKLPIIIAVNKNCTKIFKLLLENNVDISKVCKYNSYRTVFSYIIEHNNKYYIKKVMKYMISKPDYMNEVLMKTIKYYLISQKYNYLDLLLNHELINEKTIKKVLKLIIQGEENASFDLKRKNKDSTNLIHFLCKNNFQSILKLLIKSNIKNNDLINIDDEYHPLYCIYKNEINNNNLITSLIDFGMAIKIQWLKNKDFIVYMLHNNTYLKAIREKKLKIINSNNNDDNDNDNDNIYEIGNPLIFAINNNLIEFFKLILKLKILQNNEMNMNLEQESPLFIAVKNNNLIFSKLILKNKSLLKCNKGNNSKEIILSYIIKNKMVEMFSLFQKELYEEEFEYYIKSIINGIFIGKIENKKHYLRFLINNLNNNIIENYDMIKNFNCKNCYYESLLHDQCYTGNIEILKIILSNSEESINDIAKEDGNTPLIISLKFKIIK
ncbi:hypothetical protein LY90DRAFT_101951 [Neocallimastix californiae]|uniref:Ankyrin n=1 Tax=Neocallimastix californiae TaxID=1754190 RepID=A0A1Y2EZX2_9FUNG|nr:hypothetical protein LY90DRAFT_101951 [Neocallimastix californiae]|eukprot:ORY77133.1 hypothetical protein LY90DRAFT_101951 [Neocallimastix californiae]